MLAMAAGADFIKTSTGKIAAGVHHAVGAVHGRGDPRLPRADRAGMVGLKLAGGIRTAKTAWQYLVIVGETLGPEWLTPTASGSAPPRLLNDLLMQRRRLATGRYQRPDDFTID